MFNTHSDEYSKPLLYRDMTSPQYNPMSMYSGGMGCYNTNFLGGIRMKGSLDQDCYTGLQKAEKENLSLAKKFLIGTGLLLTGMFLK